MSQGYDSQLKLKRKLKPLRKKLTILSLEIQLQLAEQQINKTLQFKCIIKENPDPKYNYNNKIYNINIIKQQHHNDTEITRIWCTQFNLVKL